MERHSRNEIEGNILEGGSVVENISQALEFSEGGVISNHTCVSIFHFPITILDRRE